MLQRLVILAVVAGSDVAAQADASVPRQLALSIVHFQNVGSYNYFGPGGGEATLSADLPSSIRPTVPTPPRGKVTGSVTWPRMSDTFGVADGGVEGINQWFVEEFRRRGYTFTDETTERARFGGFIDPKTGPVGRGGYCAGSDLLNIDVLPIDRRSVEYRVRVTQSHQNCSGRMHGRPPAFADPPEFPVLLNPAGTTQTYAMFNNNCGEREFGGSSTGVLLTTSMSPADLIKHYDRQMAAAGWKQTPVPSTATSTWTKPDAAGEDVVITLTASAGRLTPNCRFVQLATIRPPGRIK